ncbi:C40 family peptidase [Aquimarina rhabdastrellae]
MLRLLPYLLFIILLASCGSSKRVHQSSKKTTTKTKKVTSTSSKSTSKKTKATAKSTSKKKIKSIINYAETFKGTRYKFGGTTKKGMDCSGLVYTSFKKENITLPRTSRAMSVKGKKISLSKVAPGDLVFFKTNKNKNVINHVGLVISTKGKVQFIHASTSRGVMVSSLSERYWRSNFVSVRRIVP